MAHVALLGDSILDNSAYTRGEPDVLTHLRTLLPPSWRATLCAVDGATTGTLGSQLPRVPRDATHLVLAIGGNDALGNIDLLTAPVRSSGQALLLFAERLAAFEGAYCSALDRVIALGRAVTRLHHLQRCARARGGYAGACGLDDVQRRHPAHRLCPARRRHRAADDLYRACGLRQPNRAIRAGRVEDRESDRPRARGIRGRRSALPRLRRLITSTCHEAPST